MGSSCILMTTRRKLPLAKWPTETSLTTWEQRPACPTAVVTDSYIVFISSSVRKDKLNISKYRLLGTVDKPGKWHPGCQRSGSHRAKPPWWDLRLFVSLPGEKCISPAGQCNGSGMARHGLRHIQCVTNTRPSDAYWKAKHMTLLIYTITHSRCVLVGKGYLKKDGTCMWCSAACVLQQASA